MRITQKQLSISKPKTWIKRESGGWGGVGVGGLRTGPINVKFKAKVVLRKAILRWVLVVLAKMAGVIVLLFGRRVMKGNLLMWRLVEDGIDYWVWI